MSKTYFTAMLFVGALLLGYMTMQREGFMQMYPGAPLKGSPMGPYDESPGGWMSSEHMPVGPTPQNHPLEENIMLLEGNEVSASCCPSTFTTDKGCVCLSGSDRRLFASRGGNK